MCKECIGKPRDVRVHPDFRDIGAEDVNAPVSRQFIDNQRRSLERQLQRINLQLFDKSRPFDFYRPQSLTGESVTNLALQPTFSTERIESIVITGPVPAAGTPSQPAVPPTGVAQQNVNSYPVTVVINANGATITNVSVNGITVGTAAGTYTVPAYGAISIAYSVATPTWAWSNAQPGLIQSSGTPFTLQLGGRVWPLLLPITGIMVIYLGEALGFELVQDDVRQLTSSVAGDWAVELMGHSETQYRES